MLAKGDTIYLEYIEEDRAASTEVYNYEKMKFNIYLLFAEKDLTK